ncbi:hypothetical protein [Desulfosporosinus sp.]|uniref:hypothetical protein n=1 Tax=Desulfosporosinus sp. TaxID=157907 RepID=UPI0026367D2D|nr:hypothetical protein [Desulfosporosinus sp.]
MQLVPKNRWIILLILEGFIVIAFWLIILLLMYFRSREIFYFSLPFFVMLELYLFIKLYKAKKGVPEHKRYIYHLCSAKRLESMKTATFGNSINKGIVHIKKSDGFLVNYSTFGKRVSYFHTSLKGYSYWFNHIFKNRLPDYLLIISFKKLDESLIYTRKIDNAILYRNDYIGPAKVINISRMKLLKRVSKNDLKLWCLDTLCVMVLLEIVIHAAIIGFILLRKTLLI